MGSLQRLHCVGAVVVASGVLASASCKTTSENQDYCSVINGDAYCAAHHGSDGRMYCIWGSQECRNWLAQAYVSEGERFDGCIAEPPEAEDECHSPCGGGLEFQEQFECPAGESSSTTGGEIMTSSTSSTGSTSGAPSACMTDEECTDDLPICVDGVCVECAPAKDDLCTSVGHVCDTTTHECVPCDAHEDCEIGACDIFEGTCFPSGSQKTMLNDSMSDIGALVASVAPGEHHVIVLAGLGAAEPYAGPILVSDGKTIAILDNGYGYPRPRIQDPEGAPNAIEVTGGATLYMQGVEVSGHMAPGTTPLSCQAAARLHARGTMVTNNVVGAFVQDCEARLENCFFQSLREDIPALRVAGDSDVELVYTTLVTNAGNDDGYNAVLSCSGLSDIVMRNSFLLSLGGGDSSPEIEGSCDSIVLEHSIVESAPVFGVGNDVLEPPLSGGDDYTGWFCNYDSGNLHLNLSVIDMALMSHMTNSNHLRIAAPAPGDDTRDIDGDLRSTPAMVGADVPMPGLSCPP